MNLLALKKKCTYWKSLNQDRSRKKNWSRYRRKDVFFFLEPSFFLLILIIFLYIYFQPPLNYTEAVKSSNLENFAYKVWNFDRRYTLNLFNFYPLPLLTRFSSSFLNLFFFLFFFKFFLPFRCSFTVHGILWELDKAVYTNRFFFISEAQGR